MSTTIQITVLFDPNRTNPNRTMSTHWAGKMKLKNQAIEAGRLAWKGAGRPQSDRPVRVSVTVRRARRMDQDNIWSALKPVKDALFCGKRFESDGGAVTPDDTDHWVRLGDVAQEVGRQWKGIEEVVFIVEPVE